MSSIVYLDKKLKVYLENSSGLFWQIPVVSAPEFNQVSSASDVSINTLPQYSSNQTSASTVTKNFKTAFQPATWSFGTQANPYNGGFKNSSEEVLWEFFTGKSELAATAIVAVTNTVNGTTDDALVLREINSAIQVGMTVTGTGINSGTTVASISSDGLTITLNQTIGNEVALGTTLTFKHLRNTDNEFSLKEVYPTFNLYFIYEGGRGYKLTDCVIVSAEVQVALGSLSTISWSGNGKKLEPTTLATPANIQNSAALATSNQIINNLSTITFSSVNSMELQEGQLLWGGVRDTKYLGSGSYSTNTTNILSLKTGDASNNNKWGLNNSSGALIATGSFPAAWSTAKYLTLDTQNTVLGLDTYNQYFNSVLEVGDQVKIEVDSSNYAVYKIASKYIQPVTDAARDFGSANRLNTSLSDDDLSSTGGYNVANTTISHYPFIGPSESSQYKNTGPITNFDATFSKHAVLIGTSQTDWSLGTGVTQGAAKWYPTSASINANKTEHTVTQDAVSSTTLYVSSTAGALSGDALYWTDINYETQTFNDVNEWAVKILVASTVGTPLFILDSPVTIPVGAKVYSHDSPSSAPPDIRTNFSTEATHSWANFINAIWYVPPGTGFNICPAFGDDATYFAEKCGQSSLASAQGNGSIPGDDPVSKSTFETKASATTARRIRSEVPVVVGDLDNHEGILAANSNLSDTTLALFTVRDHPHTMHIWAPFKQPTYIKVYEYDSGTNTGSLPIKFVPKTGGGYYKADGSTEITPTSLTINADMWKNQICLAHTTSTSFSNADQRVGYLIESDVPICGVSQGASHNDSTHLSPMATHAEGIVGSNFDDHILIDANASSGSTAATVSVTNESTGSTGVGSNDIGETRLIKPSQSGSKLAAFQIADGNGTEATFGLQGKRLGDYYVYPDSKLGSFRIIPYLPDASKTSGTIYVRSAAQNTEKFTRLAADNVTETLGADGTSGTYAMSFSVSRDSASLTDTKIEVGPTDGTWNTTEVVSGSGSKDIVLTGTGTISAGEFITCNTANIGSTEEGARFQLGGTGQYYRITLAQASENRITLDRSITLSSTPTTVTLDYTEVSSLTGPIYFQGDVQFVLTVNNEDKEEATMLGARLTGAASSTGARTIASGAILTGMGITAPTQNTTFIRQYPLRGTSVPTPMVYAQDAKTVTASPGVSYTFHTDYFYSQPSGKIYAMDSYIARNDGDGALELELLDAVGNITSEQVDIKFSRELNGSSNAFTSSVDIPLLEASLSLKANHAAVSGDTLGNVSYPVSFSRGNIIVSGSFGGYITGTGTAGDTKQFVTDIANDTNPISSLNLNIGGTTANKSITFSVPKAFIGSPNFSSSEALSFTCDFSGVSPAITTPGFSSIAKITYN